MHTNCLTPATCELALLQGNNYCLVECVAKKEEQQVPVACGVQQKRVHMIGVSLLVIKLCICHDRFIIT